MKPLKTCSPAPPESNEGLRHSVLVVLITEPSECRRFEGLPSQHRYLGDLKPVGEQT